MSFVCVPYGTAPDGSAVYKLKLSRENGISATMITYGATLTALHVKDRDVVLGYNSLDEYLQDTASIGVTVGRYANRIADGKFTLNGTEYDIGRNEVTRNGHLHGGEVGFQKKNWTLSRCFENAFELTLHSPDGDMGYPGNLDLVLRVALDEPDTLSFTYTATTDKDTVVNFTNHAYFNLNGYDGGDILDTELQLFANAILPVNERLIPNGDYLPVEGTPFDFQNAKSIGADIRASHEQLLIGGGYDHNFILSTDGFAKAAAAHSPRSGITMECYTDQPGIQLYTGNFLESPVGKGGPMTKHQGFCLETQHYPDSPHHPQFPTTVLKVGETFSSRTAYKFIY